MPASAEALRIPAVVILAALLLGACSDAASTTTSLPPVEFGEGEIPSGIPDDFPIPEGSVVGSTLVDRTNVRTEMELRVRSDLVTAVAFYVNRFDAIGYEIVSSQPVGDAWVIEFRRDDVTGRVDFALLAPDVTSASVEVNEL